MATYIMQEQSGIDTPIHFFKKWILSSKQHKLISLFLMLVFASVKKPQNTMKEEADWVNQLLKANKETDIIKQFCLSKSILLKSNIFIKWFFELFCHKNNNNKKTSWRKWNNYVQNTFVTLF